jgi:hypothetical protein
VTICLIGSAEESRKASFDRLQQSAHKTTIEHRSCAGTRNGTTFLHACLQHESDQKCKTAIKVLLFLLNIHARNAIWTTTETSKTKPRAPGGSPLGEDIDKRTIPKPITLPIPPLTTHCTELHPRPACPQDTEITIPREVYNHTKMNTESTTKANDK